MSYHHAIYLKNRTSVDLKEKLAGKLQIDPKLITRIFWENGKGLKVLVDDDMVQHIPEAQTMTADTYGISHIREASSGVKPSAVEVKLLF